MNIGAAAQASGVSAKMIRYYESVGLIPAPARSQAGYRRYGTDDVHRLRFVRRARALGFSIEEIRALLGLWQDRDRRSADVQRVARGHIQDLQRRISQLEQMRCTLEHLVAGCAGDARPDCPILAGLAGEEIDLADGTPKAGAR